MTRLATLAFTLLISLTAATAHAGEAIEALAGDWLVESFDGDAIQPEMEMKVTFVDDQTMKMSVTFNGELFEEKEVRYTATEDGEITVFADEDDEEAEDQSARWEITDDGKLHISAEEDGEMVLTRA